jgi:2-oxoglutarate/2-oxoacid ferredoxin oxidoreductase subunit alpha
VNELDLIVAGQAGQGLQVISRTLGRMLVRAGYHVFVSQDVMSRIRGGHNFARVRVSTAPVAADGDKAQILVALDPALVARHIPDLTDDAVVVTEDAGELPEDLNVVRLPLAELAREHGKDPVMVNAVAVGAALALTGFWGQSPSVDSPLPAGLEEVFSGQFGSKGEDVVERNVAAAEDGFHAIMEDQKRCCPHRLLAPGTAPRDMTGSSEETDRVPASRLLISGAEALALGAIAAGVRVVTGYPMSPATPIVEYCFRYAQEAGLIVEQTEDEVSAANLAIGAAFAGARSMVCTAGGGFCLMNEALSLAGMTETPLVLCVGMRPGPATGMATRTEQADLLFSIYAGHGEFPRAVLTPADAARAFQAAQDAFRIADEYQTPVIVLFDQFMADALWTVERDSLKIDNRQGRQERQVPEGLQPYSYRRYEVTESGVSPMVLPGTAQQLVSADSDEHTEEGHIAESAAMRLLMVNKRNAKLNGIRQELGAEAEVKVEVEGKAEAETLVFCFGSSRGVVSEALARLRDKGLNAAMVHLNHVWPFPTEAVARLVAKERKFVTVEQNFSGQLAQLLLQECGVRAAGTVRRYDGRQFTVAEVEAGLEELIRGKRQV